MLLAKILKIEFLLFKIHVFKKSKIQSKNKIDKNAINIWNSMCCAHTGPLQGRNKKPKKTANLSEAGLSYVSSLRCRGLGALD